MNSETFAFGGFAATPVATTPLTVTFVGLHPIVDGHVIVAPKRKVARLAELTAEELDALFLGARAAAAAAAPTAEAFNFCLKDGAAAGQPVAHAHVHVLPRVRGDLEGDAVYGLLDEWAPGGPRPAAVAVALDVPDDADRAPRARAAMAAEAATYRDAAAALGYAPPPSAPVAFGPRISLDPATAFYASRSGKTVAVVNLKPLVPGHVLVLPTAPGDRLADLDDGAYRDLWRAVARVAALATSAVGAAAATVAVQDGAAAGQSVPHVHVHVLPRSDGRRE